MCCARVQRACVHACMHKQRRQKQYTLQSPLRPEVALKLCKPQNKAVARNALTPFTRSKPERKYLANNLGLLVKTSRAGAIPKCRAPPTSKQTRALSVLD